MKLPKDLNKLVGRKVYFRISKKKFKESHINKLIPNKRYIILSIDMCSCSHSATVFISDGKYDIVILIGIKVTCAHLKNQTKWILAPLSETSDETNPSEEVKHDNS